MPKEAVDNALWTSVIDDVKVCVVALKMTYLRSFSGDHPSTSRATGFLVADDLILTNKHVSGCGPVHMTALFDQNEEVEVIILNFDNSDLVQTLRSIFF